MLREKWGWRALGGLGVCMAACGGSVTRDGADTASGGSSGKSGIAGASVMSAGGRDPGAVAGTGGKKPSGPVGKGGAPSSSGTSSGGKAPIGGVNEPCVPGECESDPTLVGVVLDCGTLFLQQLELTLYALAEGSGRLYAIAKSGGPPTLVTLGLGGATAFAVDATNAYVAWGQQVIQVNLTNGSKTQLVAETTAVTDVAVERGKIYYAAGHYIKQADAKTPSVGTVVAQSADEGEAYGVAVSGNYLLYASNLSFNVETDPIFGDEHVKLAASQGSLVLGHRSIQADGTNVYWANGVLLSRSFIDVNALGAVVGQPTNGASVTAFAVDPEREQAYFGTVDGTFEMSTFIDARYGNDATRIARGLTKVTSVVVDGSYAYLADGCQILKSVR